MATVFLNGRFLTQDEAMLSAFDAGVQHGVGLFETMGGGVREGVARVFRLEEHVERLVGSARELGLSDRLRAPALVEAVLKTVEHSGLESARVRLTVTGGDLNLLGRGAEKAVQPTILIVAQPATVYPAQMFERGVGVTVADLKVNPLDPMAGHKTLSYWGRLRELQLAAVKQAGEALVFQVTNHLAGGCVSNAFLVKDGRLLTPIARGEETERQRRDEETDGDGGRHARGVPVPSPVLPGVTRRWVLEWAAGIGFERRMLTISDVLGADEVFLTNSSWGVLPVVRVEKEAIGDGEVGPVTRAAMEAWEAATDDPVD